MRSDLLALEAELDEIADLIQSYQRADTLHASISVLEDAPGEISRHAHELLDSKTRQRKYNYVAVIIGLYGAMEQYIEAIIASYSKMLPGVCGRFDNIPDDIRMKHHELTVDYLSAIKQRRVHQPEDVETIVHRLARCRLRATIYELNARAFTLRTANMNFDRMKQLASNLMVQVTPRRLVNTVSFEAYYSSKNGEPFTSIGEAEAKAAFSLIDDLVSRRNHIAHGANSVDDIEDHPILCERVEHLRMYGRAIYEIFKDHILRLCDEKGRTKSLGVPFHKYNGNIVCFHMEDGNISVGDTVIMLPSDDNYPAREGKVLSLRMNDVSFNDIVGTEGCRFGVKLPFVPSETAHYGVLQSKINDILES